MPATDCGGTMAPEVSLRLAGLEQSLSAHREQIEAEGSLGDHIGMEQPWLLSHLQHLTEVSLTGSQQRTAK